LTPAVVEVITQALFEDHNRSAKGNKENQVVNSMNQKKFIRNKQNKKKKKK